MSDSPWGGGGWGVTPWGAGAGAIAIGRMRAIRSNVIRVWFAAPAVAQDPSGFRDALNPSNWDVQTNPTGGYAPPVMRVDVGPGQPLGSAAIVDLWLLTALEQGAAYQITPSDQIASA